MKGRILQARRTQFDGIQLTWIQKLVCKWFKIEPLIKYYQKFEIVCENDLLRTGDIILGVDFNQWYVNKFNGVTELICIYPIPEVTNMVGEFFITTRTRPEL